MSIKITSWNVNGIRAREKSFALWNKTNSPDIICLQELKAAEEQLPESFRSLSSDYHFFLNGSTIRKGYSGTGILVKKSLKEHSFFSDSFTSLTPSFDMENRVVEIQSGKFSIINVYVPRGEKDDHYQHKLVFFKSLEKYISEKLNHGDHVILCGDMNVAHRDIDVYYSKVDQNMVGLRPKERSAIDSLLGIGLHDSFRHLYPDKKDSYTWWPYWRGARERNLGWRIDAFYVSKQITSAMIDVVTDKHEDSSDHSPVSLTLT